MSDKPQFLQISTSLKNMNLIPQDAKQAIDLMFSQYADESLDLAAPEALAYESKSHGIVDMLEKLEVKFTDELTQLEKDEMESKHAFKMLMDDMDQQIADATSRRDEKAAERADKLSAKA